MINYSGDIDVSGSVKASNGDHAVFSGDVGVDLSLTYDQAGNGTGSETINGSLGATLYYSNGQISRYTVPFGPLTGSVAINHGTLTIAPETVVSVGGISVSLTGSGTIVDNLEEITETITAMGSGSYSGVSFSETVTARGTLVAAPPSQNTKVISGYVSGYGDPLSIYGVIDIYGVDGAGIGGTGLRLDTPDHVVVSSATVKNIGTGAGIILADGGSVSNVSWGLAGVSGLVSGSEGVYISGGAGTVSNHATIRGASAGVEAGAAATATVINYGTIETTGVYGVLLKSTHDVLVVEYGSTIIGRVAGAGGTLELGGGRGGPNRGVVTGLGGVGTVTGSAYATFSGFGTYEVDGFLGLSGNNSLGSGRMLSTTGSLSLNGSLINAGTIAGSATVAGLSLLGQAFLDNAAATAMISGQTGVYVGAGSAATLENFGLVQGTYRYGVEFNSNADRLIVEAGSKIVGLAKGGGGTLELAGGAGTISGSGTLGTLTGAAAVTFSGFGDVVVDAGASWVALDAVASTLTSFGTLTISGSTTPGILSIAAGLCIVAPGAGLTDVHVDLSGGELVVEGPLVTAGGWSQSAGTLWVAAGSTLSLASAGDISGRVVGGGTLAITGYAQFSALAQFTVAAVSIAGPQADVLMTTSLSYAGAWTQAGGLVFIDTSTTLTFKGNADVFTGTVFEGDGAIAFVGGADTLRSVSFVSPGAQAPAPMVTITNAAVTLAGTIYNDGTISASTASLTIGAGGARLTGHGTLVLSDQATNRIYGSTSTATLINVDSSTISGAGRLGAGSMKLVNTHGALIDGDQSLALNINTGAATIVNGGWIEASGAGGVIVWSAIANTGLLYANGGVLTLAGPVTGKGRAQINGGALVARAAFEEAVAFGASGGALTLAQSQSYSAWVSGFSATGATSLDLTDVRFVGAKEATFKGSIKAGVLTVSDGTHTAMIHLAGDFVHSTFTASSDGAGGVVIVASTPAQSPQAFVAAMAAVASPGDAAMHGNTARRAHAPMLATPHG